MFKLHVTYYNEFSKQTYWKSFEQVNDLMKFVTEQIQVGGIDLIDFHSNEKDKWFICVKSKITLNKEL